MKTNSTARTATVTITDSHQPGSTAALKQPTDKYLIVVLGPTAVGKTDLAIQLARSLDTEIISADSRQFFSELSIGVARPSAQQLAAAKHHFIGHLLLTEDYNAGRFEADALQVLHYLFQQRDYAICAGGSALYLDALLYGLDELPADKALKAELKKNWQERGLQWLRDELRKVDPDYCHQVDLHNPHRLMRAIEVSVLTGKPYSTLRSGRQAQRPFTVIKIGLNAPRHLLYQRINERVDVMLDAGLEEECRSVYPLRHHQALHTVGYTEMFQYFDGHMSLEEAVEKIKQHSRNLAKRQLTWWRKDNSIYWIDIATTTDVLHAALKHIRTLGTSQR